MGPEIEATADVLVPSDQLRIARLNGSSSSCSHSVLVLIQANALFVLFANVSSLLSYCNKPKFASEFLNGI
jgi:hypothetical protein